MPHKNYKDLISGSNKTDLIIKNIRVNKIYFILLVKNSGK